MRRLAQLLAVLRWLNQSVWLRWLLGLVVAIATLWATCRPKCCDEPQPAPPPRPRPILPWRRDESTDERDESPSPRNAEIQRCDVPYCY
ncbi:MAG TPA: hypothetical protein VFV87_20485 [Pirellulaceae bacterium]|nr:hypothetical protein [Pirellulaceae bacterium]